MIELAGVTVTYGAPRGGASTTYGAPRRGASTSPPALAGVTLQIDAGAFAGIIGPNGAGKTTLLRTMAGLARPVAGQVRVDGQQVSALAPRTRARLVAVVPQVEGPPPGFTVREAVAMGRTPHLRRLGPPQAADRDAVEGAMGRARVDALGGRLVETLSGGERQRVLIARALAQDPRVLLLDEPTAHLDVAVQLEIMEVLAGLHRAGLTLVAAFHDLNLAAAFCRRVLLLDRGRVVADGLPEAVLTAEILGPVYRADFLVRPHPLGGRPLVTVLGRIASAGGGSASAAMPDGAAARPLVIAIDGPMGSGKSTVARAVAARLSYRYINTGAMYRAVAREALRRGVDPQDAAALEAIARILPMEFVESPGGQRLLVAGEDVSEAITDPAVSEAASLVSVHPPVRDALVARQRQLGGAGGVVMEGRDIGTVVFPQAEVKVFLNATPQERARRRFEELRARGAPVDYEALRAAEEARDQRDRERAHSPLRVAPDALIIDTTGKSPGQVAEEILALAQRRSVAERSS
ncbi:MAG: (d)CMP kinase [bacterium]